jgi:hypothetical protein
MKNQPKWRFHLFGRLKHGNFSPTTRNEIVYPDIWLKILKKIKCVPAERNYHHLSEATLRIHVNFSFL